MDVYNIEETLETSDFLIQNVENSYQDFQNTIISDLEAGFLEHQRKTTELSASIDKIEYSISEEFTKLEECIRNITQDSASLKQAEGSLQTLKALEAQKERESSVLKNEVESLKKMIVEMTEQDTEEKRDEILVYKVLTKTEFYHKSKEVIGRVNSNPPKPISFNPTNMTREELSRKLWKLVLDI